MTEQRETDLKVTDLKVTDLKVTDLKETDLYKCSELRVIISPVDFAASVKYYSENFAWTKTRDWDRPDGKGVMFDTGSGIVELLSGYFPASRTQGVHLSFRVPDVWRLWTAVMDKSEIIFPLRQNSWGDDSFCLMDPNGLALTFFTERS